MAPSALEAAGSRIEESTEGTTVRVRLTGGQDSMVFATTEPAQLHYAQVYGDLPPGTYRASVRVAQPAIERFILFSKTFGPDEGDAESAYLKSLESVGYAPEVHVIGRQFVLENGERLDNRRRWIGITSAESSEAAQTVKSELEREGIWTWLRAERVVPAGATLVLASETGKVYGPFPTPTQLELDSTARIMDAEFGYLETRRGSIEVSGALTFDVDPAGGLEVIQRVALEDYLRGVVAAEMPAEWPEEALKAQAVAARSEVLASLGARHVLENADFCALEHCRAYSGRQPASSRAAVALRSTEGEVLREGSRIVPAVFSSNCGGWTSNNETAWSGPADAALRARSDLVPGNGSAPVPSAMERLVRSTSTYCSDDARYFRWERTYSGEEVHAMMNAQYPLGEVVDVETGSREESGRLEWIRVSGSRTTVTIRKDLPIRTALGGIPSTLIVLDVQRQSGRVSRLSIRGGGRGHGVGLCQFGARGRAVRGQRYSEILAAYFQNSRVVRLAGGVNRPGQAQ